MAGGGLAAAVPPREKLPSAVAAGPPPRERLPSAAARAGAKVALATKEVVKETKSGKVATKLEKVDVAAAAGVAAAAVPAAEGAVSVSEAALIAASGTASIAEPVVIGDSVEDRKRRIKNCVTAMKFAVPIKNLLTCYLLGPTIRGECGSEHMCIPWLNLLLMILDIAVFSAHLSMAIKQKVYRDHVTSFNFYILLLFWTLWNVCSHPFCRQHLLDLFAVAPPEIHVTINIVATAVCSSCVMPPPGLKHVLGLVGGQFFISLALSTVEALHFHMNSGWLSAVRLDIVMFNVAILLIGSTIIIGTMTVEKDIKSLAHEMETRLGPSGSFEDDLERRKRAVLTALCDAVLTTNSSFLVIGSEEGADKIFRRSMLNETLTDYFKDPTEKDKFLTAVRKQFPDDGAVGEGPKRMRLALRDNNNEPFEADIVVSDASTDEHGKVNKYMVGMHIRGEFRVRAAKRQQLSGTSDRRHHRDGGGTDAGEREVRAEGRRGDKAIGEPQGEDRTLRQMYDELSKELLVCFDSFLRPLPEPPDGSFEPGAASGSGGPSGSAADSGSGGGTAGAAATSSSCGAAEDAAKEDVGTGAAVQPRFHLRRASCEIFRRRTPLLGARTGERGHVDLRRLSLPEPSMGGLA